MSNPMLTLVNADCVRCGSTSETVQRDREVRPLADAVCCDLDDLMRLDPREPYADYGDLMEPEVECYLCSSRTRSPFRIGTRAFCSRACGRDYAE
jgi:hypothetical protein